CSVRCGARWRHYRQANMLSRPQYALRQRMKRGMAAKHGTSWRRRDSACVSRSTELELASNDHSAREDLSERCQQVLRAKETSPGLPRLLGVAASAQPALQASGDSVGRFFALDEVTSMSREWYYSK